MKLTNCNSRGYGIGSNPGGGRWAIVQIETSEELAALRAAGAVPFSGEGFEPRFFATYWLHMRLEEQDAVGRLAAGLPVYAKVDRNGVEQVGRVPLGTGLTAAYRVVEAALGDVAG